MVDPPRGKSWEEFYFSAEMVLSVLKKGNMGGRQDIPPPVGPPDADSVTPLKREARRSPYRRGSGIMGGPGRGYAGFAARKQYIGS